MKNKLSYEDREILNEYLAFHYGEEKDLLPWECLPREALNYPIRSVTETFDLESLPQGGRGLDVGCAVGRSTFELARQGLSLVGVDYSRSFIEAAEAIRTEGKLPYQLKVQGNIYEEREALRPEGIDPVTLRFATADAHDLSGLEESFDCVLAANLLCRLHKPATFLNQLEDLLVPGGQLVILTPCTWSSGWTPEANWIGGTPSSGRTEAQLKVRLEQVFELEWEGDLPFLIREHERKYQLTVAHGMRWRRR